MLKPNQAELEELLRTSFHDDHAIARGAMSLTSHASIVCVSLASRGAILATRSRAWFAAAPRVHARGTVGAGDSMVGAMATRLVRARLFDFALAQNPIASRKMPEVLTDALTYGIAAGAATAEAEGTRLADPKRIHALCSKVKISVLF